MARAIRCDRCGEYAEIPDNSQLPKGWLAVVVYATSFPNDPYGGERSGGEVCSDACARALIAQKTETVLAQWRKR